MSTPSYAQLGPYELIAPIGKGGMGEVWRARDPRLGREVAIKISAQQFNNRFETEARAIAALNHPNICQLYDVGPNYLVMELIEGESPKGPLPLDKALRIMRQIADALDAAHEKGIVHRDLKPGNIKIKPDGTVKVLDFGLAKTAEAPAGDPHSSPTLTISSTGAGMILGTAAYMSPEQARGKAVDKRSDIWAFGVVFYELLTGSRPFRGENLTETLASLMKDTPDMSAAPAAVRPLLEKCLEKDPKLRLRDIGDVWLMRGAPASSPSSAPRKWILLSCILPVIAVGLGIFAFLRPAPTAEPYRLAINPPPGLHFDFDNSLGGTAISPDGRKIVFAAGGDLWIRPVDSETAAKVGGTSGASYPFWSPDQRFIGFFTRRKLVTIELASGSRMEVSDVRAARGGSWNAEGTILYAPIDEGVYQVPRLGGKPVAVTKLDEFLRETAHYHPSFLPDGDHFLYMIRSRDPANSDVFVGSLKDHKLKRRVASALSSAAFVPATHDYPGYLLFVREGALFAQRFDEGALKTVEEPEALAASVGFMLNNQTANFSASRTGTVVLGTAGTPLVQMMWLDRRGDATPVALPANPYVSFPRLSRDGARVALFKYTGRGGFSLWSFDFKRGSLSLIDEDGGESAWSADDQQILYYVYTHEALVRKALNSTQPAQVIAKLDQDPTGPIDWSPDAKFAVAQGEVWNVASGRRVPSRLPNFMVGPRFSPNSKWLAYVSADGEIVCQDFPEARARIQVSNRGGSGPVWRGDMKELFYIKSPALMAVDVRSTGSGLEFGIPHELFTSSILKNTTDFFCDATRDGQRFLCLAAAPSNPLDDQLTILINWRAGLRK